MSKEYAFTGNEKATRITSNMQEISVKYHNTVVAKISWVDRTVIFDSGGWETATTRRRMNQTCNTYKLPYFAYILNGELWIQHSETKEVWGNFPVTLPI